MNSSTRIRQGAAGILLFVIGILMSLVLHRPAPEHLREFSMERLLRTSLLPVGQTMYIWGGGWNQDGCRGWQGGCHTWCIKAMGGICCKTDRNI